MIKSFAIIIIVCMFGFKQQPEFLLKKEYDIKANFIATDQFGNLFIVKGSEISKFDEKENKTIKFSDRLFGQISSVDVSDPFRILIFNKDFNKILFLDKNLTEIISPVFLDNLGFYNIAAVCQSNNSGFWIFDQNLDQLVYLDQTLNITKKSSQFSSILKKEIEITHVFMLEKNDYIYLGISGEGVLLFDSYGTYIKTFPIEEIKSFQIIDETIIYSSNEKLIFYNTKNFEKENIDLPVPDCINARLERNRLFIQSKEKVFVYQANEIN